MPAVTQAPHKNGDYFVDYESKVFEDVKADTGEKALITFHTVAFEGSIGLVNILNAIRMQRKGYETSILLYGPGVTLGLQALYGHGEPSLIPGIIPIQPQDVLDCILLHKKANAIILDTWTV